jgi:PPOX class probable F420-dependent enzyme
MTRFDEHLRSALGTAKNLYVATERKDGSRSEPTPIWFMADADAVWFTTVPGSWKAKRVRLGRPLHVHVGARGGPYFKGRGTIVTDPAVAARMAPVYARRYWLAWLGLFRPNPARVRRGETLIVRVVPWQDQSPS